MNRSLVGVLVCLGILAGVLMLPIKTLAEQGKFQTCTTTGTKHAQFKDQVTDNPDDEHFFPYGFVCGGAAHNPFGIGLSANPSSKRILQGSNRGEIDFTTSYSASGDAKANGSIRGVLLWLTIDITNDLFSGITDTNGGDISSSGGDVSRTCPGSFESNGTDKNGASVKYTKPGRLAATTQIIN